MGKKKKKVEKLENIYNRMLKEAGIYGIIAMEMEDEPGCYQTLKKVGYGSWSTYSNYMTPGELDEEIRTLIDGAKMATRLEVPTTAGTIKAEMNKDTGRPGIAVTLNPAGYEIDMNVTNVSVCEDLQYASHEGIRPCDVEIRTYSNVYADDYASKNILLREDVEMALEIPSLPSIFLEEKTAL